MAELLLLLLTALYNLNPLMSKSAWNYRQITPLTGLRGIVCDLANEKLTLLFLKADCDK